MTLKHRLVTDVNAVLNGRAHIAGGAIRSCFQGQDPRDIDIFMTTPDIREYEDVCRELWSNFGYSDIDWRIVDMGNKADANYWAFDFTMSGTSVTISVVTPAIMYSRKTYGSLHDIVNDIDLSVCRFGLLPDNTLYSPDNMKHNISDILHKAMHLVKSRGVDEALRTERRIKKYEGYGFTLLHSDARDVWKKNLKLAKQHEKSRVKKLRKSIAVNESKILAGVK